MSLYAIKDGGAFIRAINRASDAQPDEVVFDGVLPEEFEWDSVARTIKAVPLLRRVKAEKVERVNRILYAKRNFAYLRSFADDAAITSYMEALDISAVKIKQQVHAASSFAAVNAIDLMAGWPE